MISLLRARRHLSILLLTATFVICAAAHAGKAPDFIGFHVGQSEQAARSSEQFKTCKSDPSLSVEDRGLGLRRVLCTPSGNDVETLEIYFYESNVIKINVRFKDHYWVDDHKALLDKLREKYQAEFSFPPQSKTKGERRIEKGLTNAGRSVSTSDFWTTAEYATVIMYERGIFDSNPQFNLPSHEKVRVNNLVILDVKAGAAVEEKARSIASEKERRNLDAKKSGYNF